MLLAPPPPLFPWLALVDGVFPAPPFAVLAELPPPPEPPFPPMYGDAPEPAPPPVDVIVEKTESIPNVLAAPPDPIVTVYPVPAATEKLVAVR